MTDNRVSARFELTARVRVIGGSSVRERMGFEVEHLFVASLVIKIIKSNCQLLVFGGTYLIKKCDKGYYKVRQLLVTNCDITKY